LFKEESYSFENIGERPFGLSLGKVNLGRRKLDGIS